MKKEYYSENMKRRDHLGDLGVGERIISLIDTILIES
jgi:hypothetical protein